jgi:site-specific DNA-methyltransferase (adenine-specific)
MGGFTERAAKPFIKWAGGKGQLLGTLFSLLPDGFETDPPETYAEPFVGGGAMLFAVLGAFPSIRRIVINDINPRLINAYTILREREADLDFTRRWIAACRKKLTPAGTIWICGTFHNIFTIGQVLEEQGFRILNAVTWQKTNPPPNLSCRFFTYSAEAIIWARREKKVPHCFNYDLMRAANGGRQMPDVWLLPAIARWEKAFGKHPTQKPLSVVTRAILASTRERDWVLDPFSGSGTTGIAANLTGRRFLGIDIEKSFLTISIERRKEIEDPSVAEAYRQKIPDTRILAKQSALHEPAGEYCCRDLPF